MMSVCEVVLNVRTCVCCIGRYKYNSEKWDEIYTFDMDKDDLAVLFFLNFLNGNEDKN